MNHAAHNKLVSFIWSIADDCLRDVYVRGKYRDVILPMVVLRRLDALLESTKDAVLEEVQFQKNDLGMIEFVSEGLEDASGYVFYNTSTWTLPKLVSRAGNNADILLANLDEYLNSFSPNVKEIIEKFKLKAQAKHMKDKDVLLDVLQKFTSTEINLTPFDKIDMQGNKQPALTNLGMGYVFEELIRKFNEDNNEEAGEHFTPREVIDLMTHLIFNPIKHQLESVFSIYDPACGSGGMLTEAQKLILDDEKGFKKGASVNLYGKEINDETYAICKSDMMIQGNDPSNIHVGSTLSSDSFQGRRFDFMLSNPPYGKSWASEQKYIKDGASVIDPRFIVHLNNYWGVSEPQDATPRSSDGQLLFLMEMVSKMSAVRPEDRNFSGSRIASVHNGSSLFTGDAGGGESNIRRHVIENDWLEAIIQLPNNLFYNTGITTYIWLLTNNKPANRKGKVQLIDASNLYRKLRKNLGNKNCEFAPEHIQQIVDTYLNLAEVAPTSDNADIASLVFNNADFGYYKVSIERPDRRKAQFTDAAIESLRFDKQIAEPMQWAYGQWGDALYQPVKAKEEHPLQTHEKAILKWCEDQEFALNAKTRAKLLHRDTWQKHDMLIKVCEMLRRELGDGVFMDFNVFKKDVDAALKAKDLKLSASDKNAILNAVSEYDETAEKVLGKLHKLNTASLAALLAHLGCAESDLPDFGYYPAGKRGEYQTYESSSDLRDSENIPLGDQIHRYFLAEVKPHVSEAWINLDSVKIGYEVSFNKYFYKHVPLRGLADVAADIVRLEQQSEGLIAQILGLGSADLGAFGAKP